MTKEAAIHKFLSSFGLDAYAATAVPKDAKLPCSKRLIYGCWMKVFICWMNVG